MEVDVAKKNGLGRNRSDRRATAEVLVFILGLMQEREGRRALEVVKESRLERVKGEETWKGGKRSETWERAWEKGCGIVKKKGT